MTTRQGGRQLRVQAIAGHRPVRADFLQLLAAFGLVLVAIGAAGALATGAFTSSTGKGLTKAATETVLFVATDGSDLNLCTQSQPCASFDRAYQVASPGSTVMVTCTGSSCAFPNQAIARSSAKPLTSKCRWGATFQDGTVAQNLSGCIHFKPDPQKTVTLDSVTIGAPYVYLDGFTMTGQPGSGGWIDILNRTGPGGGCEATNPYTDIIIRNVSARNFNVQGVAYTSIVNSTFDAQGPYDNFVLNCADDPHPYSTNHLLLDHVTVKNVLYTLPGQHVEGIHWYSGDQVLITGSKFLNLCQYGIFFDGDRDNLTHITIENSVFDATASHQSPPGNCQAALAMSNRDTRYQTANNIIRFNSFSLGDWPAFSSAGNMSNIRVYGSVMGGPPNQASCDNFTAMGVTFDHNVFTSQTACGSTNSTGNSPSSLYVDPANYDYSLKRGSRAITFVPLAKPRPRTDIVRALRPLRSSTDAGSVQWETAAIVLGRSIGALRIGDVVSRAIGFYGRPKHRTSLRIGVRTVDRLTFSVHRGLLWAMVEHGAIVGVGTASPYYTTGSGIGVGAPTTSIGGWRGLTWARCRSALRHSFGPVDVFVKPNGGRHGRRIVAMTMIQNRYGYGACSS